MSTIDVLTGFAILAFVGVFVGCSVLASGEPALERRAALLERRDPAAAEALRRAQASRDLSYIGMFGDGAFFAVCTPSRRSMIEAAELRAADDEYRFALPEDASPPKPAPVAALAGGSHVALSRRAVRRARATTRQPAGTR